jgi:maltodextrin utilization protein YvdJ
MIWLYYLLLYFGVGFLASVIDYVFFARDLKKLGTDIKKTYYYENEMGISLILMLLFWPIALSFLFAVAFKHSFVFMVNKIGNLFVGR